MNVRDSIVELKETKLWIYLNQIDISLAEQCATFVTRIAPLLKSIHEYFPFYTRHDTHHGYRVLQRMDQIIDRNCLVNDHSLHFTSTEAFLLICSAYGHDLGMTIFPGEEDQLLKELNIIKDDEWKHCPDLQRFLRENHSNRGGQYINKHYDDIGVPKHLISHLNSLMLAHNLSIGDFEKQLGVRVAAGEKELDLKQLACILCIADALEFSETRVVDGVLNALEEKIKNNRDMVSLTSYRENMKHVCIGDNLAIGSDGKVIISGTFDDPEVLSLAHKTIDLIEIWIRNYSDIDLRSAAKRLILRGDSIERSLDILGCDFERLGIRINKEHIINLVSSHSTWSSNKGVVLREILQNSVEACRYRQFNSSKADQYRPKINVLASRSEQSITITDNGCGMSRTTILNNFLNVGNSRSHDPSYKNSGFHSLARFGIGFWSAFTIAKKATVETAPFEYVYSSQRNNGKVDGLSFDVSIEELKDYSLLKKIERFPGTTITLWLKDEIGIDDLLQHLKSLIICSEIPLEINYDQETYAIPFKPKLKSFNDVTGAKRDLALSEKVKEFVFEKDFGDLDFKMKLFYRIDNDRATFTLSNKKRGVTFALDSILNTSSKFGICGFLIGFRANDLIFDFHRVGIMACNTNDPNNYVFDLNRLTLLSSESTTKAKNIITSAIHEAYLKFIKDTNSFNNESIYKLNQESKLNGGNVYGGYSKYQLFDFHSKIPQLLSFKLFKIESNGNFGSTSITYELFDSLKLYDAEIWAMTTFVFNFNDNIRLYPEEMTYQLILVLKQTQLCGDKAFFIEPNNEVSLLFDNDPRSCVYILNFTAQKIKLPFLKVFTKSLKPYDKHDWHICTIQGVWTGSILEKQIYGATFVFISHHKLIVQPNSLIAAKIKEHLEHGQTMKLCSLAKKLYDHSLGFTDDTIKIYL